VGVLTKNSSAVSSHVAWRFGVRKSQHLSIVVLVLLSESTLSAGPPAGTRLTPVSKANLCVTEGSIEETPDHRLSVNVAKMRAYVNAYTQPEAQVQFTYLGATPNEVPLASGEMRATRTSSRYAARRSHRSVQETSTPCAPR
jgi:hypothetical protein